jgi:hypothetical protein
VIRPPLDTKRLRIRPFEPADGAEPLHFETASDATEYRLVCRETWSGRCSSVTASDTRTRTA